ncbi:MAG: MogA/MoaB family molybdenum cofactor biosynthesis protein [Salinivirgaceae bacterium]
MKILSIFRITSHKQHVEVDDTSTSPNKVSNQVLIFEKQLPGEELLKLFTKGTSVGTILVIDAFTKEPFNAFDTLTGSENDLHVLKLITIEEQNAILCLPANFLTFYLGQKLAHKPKIFSIRVVTLSDRAHRGVYEDKSGPAIVKLVTEYFEINNKKSEANSTIIPDNTDELSLILEECKIAQTDVLITTGGTGISQRDITIETVIEHIDKEIPGIMEMIRLKYGAQNPNALLSRSIAGTMNQTLVYTLPGSPQAVKEYLQEIFLTLDHLLYMIHGIDVH